MKKGIYIPLLLIGIILISAFSLEVFQKEKSEFSLITTTRAFTAGSAIEISFSSSNKIKELPVLVLNHSYGSTIIDAELKENKILFKIPIVFSKKTGILNWNLISNGISILKNSIEIIPFITSKTVLESYLGPPSIQAGNRDYSMLVVIPTDMFDNPLPENTLVNINEQFLESISTSEEKTKDFVAWKNIYSKEKSGDLLISSSCNSTNSKELTTIIYPSNATNFNISFNRNHSFADGNQLTQLITSPIKDEFENLISDGTMVEFTITNEKNQLLKTSASTINGIANAKILHPDYPTIWKVKAFISGLAESNTLNIPFKAVISDFDVKFSKNNSEITVGPLLSFMNQLIPDGALVKLHIYEAETLVETKTATSFKGYVIFNVSPAFYKENYYSFMIETLGISKKIEPINYAK
jgi:hypothetical protein